MIKSSSIARAIQLRQYAKQRVKFLAKHPTCEAHEKIRPTEPAPTSVDLHHVRGRQGSLLLDETGFLAVCRKCHSFMRDFTKEAREMGFLAPLGSWNSTSKTQHKRRIDE